GVGEAGVHQREVGVRVGLGRGLDGVLEEEAGADGQVAPLLDHGVDVRGEVGVALRLGLGDLDAQAVAGAGEAGVGGLVEGLVVEAAGVGDHAGLEVGAVAAGRGLVSGVGGRGVVAGRGVGVVL